MAIQGYQVWLQAPDFHFLIPDLSAERIQRAATDALQGGLAIAGIVNGGFAIADVLNNRLLPALAHGGTSIVCLSTYSVIGELRARIDQLETLASQMRVLERNNQTLQAQIIELSNISSAFERNSTDFKLLENRISESIGKLEKLVGEQELPAVRTLLSQVQGLFVGAKERVLSEIMTGFKEIKDELVRTSQNNEKQREALTSEYNRISQERSQLEFLKGLVPRVLAIAESQVIYQELSIEDQRRISALRQSYDNYASSNNQVGQPP